MISVRNAILIDAPLKEVFDFLANPEKFSLWNYYVKSVHKVSSGQPVIGSRFRQVRKNDEQIFEITGYAENILLEFTTIPGSPLRFKRQLRFSETDDQSAIEDYFELDTGHPLILQKLLRKKIEGSIKKNLVKLKELLETGQTTLQNGRVSFI